MAEDLKRTLAVGEFLRVESMSDGILRLVFKAETRPTTAEPMVARYNGLTRLTCRRLR